MTKNRPPLERPTMPTAKIGERCVALRSADATHIYLYGRGVYAGRKPVPYWNPDVPALGDGQTWREAAIAQVTHEMSQPRVEFVWKGVASGCDQWGNPMDDDRTYDERVQDRIDGIGGNPRIDLDGGGSAFGYFCWWTTEADYDARIRPGREEVLVPLPDPLPHSLLTTPPVDSIDAPV
jgi:hypothetical protein